jgi:D-aspartate ligase
MEAQPSGPGGAVVVSGTTSNTLGVIRGFGRRGIPVVHVDSAVPSWVRHSRYVSRRLKLGDTGDGDSGLVDCLMDLGRQIDQVMTIIPTGDSEVLALAKYRSELERFYRIPVPGFELVDTLVNKRRLYKLLGEMRIPHPRTYFPNGVSELESMCKEIGYPFVIKPAYSTPFQIAFHCKGFLVASPQDLELAVARLNGREPDVVVQDFVPGPRSYAFYTYLDAQSEPLASCGYDKLRHYPPELGSGSFCRSAWRPDAMEPVLKLLGEIGYRGFAEPELKRDPRDGEYKVIEINARTTSQNRLAAACGVDLEYIAYLDMTGRFAGGVAHPREGVTWVEDFADQVSCLMLMRRGQIGIMESIQSIRPGLVHSVAAWDDPVPFFARAAGLISSRMRLPARRPRT